MRRKINFYISIFIVLAFCFVTCGCDTRSRLKAKIQKEFDSNPFLKEENITLKILNEENGYVKVVIEGGGPDLREYISNGADLLSPLIESDFQLRQKSEAKTYNALKKSLETVKAIKGVKAITVVNSAKNIFEEGMEAYENRNYKKAATIFEQAAEQGELKAQLYLAYLYNNGDGVPRDQSKALELYRKVAEGSNEDLKYQAQRTVGWRYEKGWGVAQDYSKAIDWYLKATSAPNPDDAARAHYALAWLHGTCKDPQYRDGKKALDYALKAFSYTLPDRVEEEHRILAAVYASNGNFEKAVEEQEKEINHSNTGKKTPLGQKYLSTLEKQLALYKARQSYIEDENDFLLYYTIY